MWRVFCKSCGAPFVVNADEADDTARDALKFSCPICGIASRYAVADFVAAKPPRDQF
jgi:RNase P subunit RPR2